MFWFCFLCVIISLSQNFKRREHLSDICWVIIRTIDRAFYLVSNKTTWIKHCLINKLFCEHESLQKGTIACSTYTALAKKLATFCLWYHCFCSAWNPRWFEGALHHAWLLKAWPLKYLFVTTCRSYFDLLVAIKQLGSPMWAIFFTAAALSQALIFQVSKCIFFHRKGVVCIALK